MGATACSNARDQQLWTTRWSSACTSHGTRGPTAAAAARTPALTGSLRWALRAIGSPLPARAA
eukprot:8705255-Lingulodinium_polyedra.AAC.1